MPHPTFDLPRWIAHYPLADHRRRVVDRWLRQAFRGGERPDQRIIDELLAAPVQAPGDIYTPEDLAVTELLRREVCAGRPQAEVLGRAAPADILVPAYGPPPHPALSKIGGVPWRPAADPWPRTPGGQPMTFLAQFNFADSAAALAQNGISRLPAAVLLIFTPGEWCMDFTDEGGEEPNSALQFEWRPLDIPDPATAASVPETSYAPAPTHFQLHRSADYPEPPPPLDEDLRISGFYWSSKIGGLPIWQQEPEPHRGRFLAALHSLNPKQDDYPFPNCPTRPWINDRPYPDFLMFGDVGTLNLFLTDDNRLSWTIQCS